MRFTKMQGAATTTSTSIASASPLPHDPAALSRAISDRHFGVGGDGLILICPSDKADARMRMFNADGSEAEMCGNGVRCVAKYVYDHGLVRKPTLTIETGRGVLTLDLEVSGGNVRQVRVDMGEPILRGRPHPDHPARRSADRSAAALADHALQGDLRVDGQPALRHLRGRRSPTPSCWASGRRSSAHPAFPRRTNVEFVRVNRPDDVTMRVWERGSGETLACGTGACAVAVAGVLTGRTQPAHRRPPARRRLAVALVRGG